MPVSARGDQNGGDLATLAQALELQAAQPAAVRELAARWTQGIQGLMALAGIAGLAGAPLAAGKLTRTAQAWTGSLLAAVLLLAAGALLLLMTSAYGEARTIPTFLTPTQRRRVTDNIAHRALRNLRIAMALALGAIAALTAAIVIAWVAPPPADLVRVTDTQGVTYCGTLTDAPDAHITVTEPSARIDLSAARIKSIETTPTCDKK